MIKIVLIVAISLLLIVSGCTGPAPMPKPTPTPPPTATPVATPAAAPGTSVEVLNAPDTAVAGKSFEISWRVNSPVEKNITHTAVHYGPESKSEPLTLQSYPILTKPYSGIIPANFTANITINTTGITYYRAHAIIDAVNYWSPEKVITISSPSNATPVVTTTAGTTPGAVY